MGRYLKGILKKHFAAISSYPLLGLLLIFPFPAFGEEEELRLLIWEGYAPTKYTEEFEKQIKEKYGREIKLEITFVQGSHDFYGPVRNKSVDLVTISHHLFKDERFNYIAKKLLLPLDLKNIPSHKHVAPALRRSKHHSANGKLYGSPVAQGPYGLAYNTKRFKQTPNTWKIFWDPKFKRKYMIGAHEYLYNANITALAMGYSMDSISSFDSLNNKKFKKKLRQLVVNAHSFWSGQDKASELLGLSLAAAWGDSLASLKKKGEVWKMAEPMEGTPWWIDEYAITWALAEKPFLKKVAEEWINRVLKPDFQVDHILRELTVGPVTVNIDNELTMEEKERIQSGTSNPFRTQRILQPVATQRDRNGLKLLWNEAMKGTGNE